MAEKHKALPLRQYEDLVSECRAALTEARFTLNWTLIETRHELGRLIAEAVNDDTVTSTIINLSSDLGTSARTLWDAYMLFKKFPNLKDIPEGKNITMRKIRMNYLSENPVTPEECEHAEVVKICACKKCGKRLSDDTVKQLKAGSKK